MKKILVLIMVIIMTQFAACKQSKNSADKGVNAVEAQAKTEKKQTLSIKEKMESSKPFYEYGCRTEKDIYTFMEISDANWKTIKNSESFSPEVLDAILNTPVRKYFGTIGFALRFAYEMKDSDFADDDLYKTSLSVFKTWFNSEDPDTWKFPDSGLF
jgi:hypothetical protein